MREKGDSIRVSKRKNTQHAQQISEHHAVLRARHALVLIRSLTRTIFPNTCKEMGKKPWPAPRGLGMFPES